MGGFILYRWTIPAVIYLGKGYEDYPNMFVGVNIYAISLYVLSLANNDDNGNNGAT